MAQKRRKPKTRWGSRLFYGAASLLRYPVCALPAVRLRCTPTAATRSAPLPPPPAAVASLPKFSLATVLPRNFVSREPSPTSRLSLRFAHRMRSPVHSNKHKKTAIPVGMTDFLELLARFELATSSLPRMRSTG